MMAKQKQTPQKRMYKWVKEELPICTTDWLVLLTCAPEPGKKMSLDYFQMFFDKDIIDLIVTFTNQYAAKKNPGKNRKTHTMN